MTTFIELVKSPIIKTYTIHINYKGDDYNLKFKLGKNYITYINDKSECIKLKYNENGEKYEYELEIESYYNIGNSKSCKRFNHDVMFHLITLFAKELNLNIIFLVDDSKKETKNCVWKLGLFEKIVKGRSFYEKYGFEYEEEFQSEFITFMNDSSMSTNIANDLLNEKLDHVDCKKVKVWFENNGFKLDNPETINWIDVIKQMNTECNTTRENVIIMHQDLKNIFSRDKTSLNSSNTGLMEKDVSKEKKAEFTINTVNKTIKIEMPNKRKKRITTKIKLYSVKIKKDNRNKTKSNKSI